MKEAGRNYFKIKGFTEKCDSFPGGEAMRTM